jgi:hypothetical protein
LLIGVGVASLLQTEQCLNYLSKSIFMIWRYTCFSFPINYSLFQATAFFTSPYAVFNSSALIVLYLFLYPRAAPWRAGFGTSAQVRPLRCVDQHSIVFLLWRNFHLFEYRLSVPGMDVLWDCGYRPTTTLRYTPSF